MVDAVVLKVQICHSYWFLNVNYYFKTLFYAIYDAKSQNLRCKRSDNIWWHESDLAFINGAHIAS